MERDIDILWARFTPSPLPSPPLDLDLKYRTIKYTKTWIWGIVHITESLFWMYIVVSRGWFRGIWLSNPLSAVAFPPWQLPTTHPKSYNCRVPSKQAFGLPEYKAWYMRASSYLLQVKRLRCCVSWTLSFCHLLAFKFSHRHCSYHPKFRAHGYLPPLLAIQGGTRMPGTFEYQLSENFLACSVACATYRKRATFEIGKDRIQPIDAMQNVRIWDIYYLLTAEQHPLELDCRYIWLSLLHFSIIF